MIGITAPVTRNVSTTCNSTVTAAFTVSSFCSSTSVDSYGLRRYFHAMPPLQLQSHDIAISACRS